MKGIDKKKKKKKSIRETITEEDVTRAIRETLSGMEDSGSGFRNKLKQRKKMEREEKEARRIEEVQRESTILRLTEFVTTADLAALMGTTAAEIIVKCMSLGLMVSINQRLNKDTITLIADDYGFQVEFLDEQAAQENLLHETFNIDSFLSGNMSTLIFAAPFLHQYTAIC